MRHCLSIFLAALTFTTALHANDIQISNPTLTVTNTLAGTTQVQFNISWVNSWRTSSAPNNWDAAWVFVKYRNANTGLWQHAQLGSDVQHSAPAGSTVATGLLTPGTAYNAATNWGVGAFIHRSANGTGTFTANNVELRWNYGQNGINYSDIAEVKVFAVEMVYVPQGSFSVGDGSTNVWGQFRNGSTNTPLLINSEAALTLGGTTNGNLANNNASGMNTPDDFNNTTTQTLPAAFPKGFAGFYLMKYSITQQQYVDFLNILTRTQQNTRTFTNVSGTSVTNRYVMSLTSTLQQRNGIRCDTTLPAAPAVISFYCDQNGNGTGGEADDGQWIACNYLSWADVAAYLDWSGLRPMSELEYEKACRGPVTPVVNEYAWGSTAITGAANITNGGAINESSNTASANAVYNNDANVQGPMRVGVFSNGGTTRAQSGASYYGAMELSGNLYERPVTVGNATGRLFEGTLGDGAVDDTGQANAATWPGTNASGAGFRGGNWYSQAFVLRVSVRLNAARTLSARDNIVNGGGRGARVFP